MKIVLDIKNDKVLSDLVDFIFKNKENIQFESYENENLNNELKESLFEVMLMKKGLIEKKEISELVNEL